MIARPLFAAALSALVMGCDMPVQPTASASGLSERQISTGTATATVGGTQRTLAARPSQQAIDTFAVNYMATTQANSFRNRSEYCGYFFVDAAGNLQADTPSRGTIDSCPRTPPPAGVVASWHSHGAYDEAYDNEVPSPNDMIGTFQTGFDGYLVTPGGRVWRIEVDDETAYQVCNQGCVAVDPGFVPEGEAGIRQSYTFQTLIARFRLGVPGRQVINSSRF